MENTLLFYGDASPYYELSNFYPHPFQTKKKYAEKIKIEFDGAVWPTSEHLYQALKFKCETVEEKEWRETIRSANTPTIAKYLGHFYTHAKYGWQKRLRDLVLRYRESVRFAGEIKSLEFRKDIMRVALRAKFQIPKLRKFLLSTGDSVLRENSSSEWRIILGDLLMELRDELK